MNTRRYLGGEFSYFGRVELKDTSFFSAGFQLPSSECDCFITAKSYLILSAPNRRCEVMLNSPKLSLQLLSKQVWKIFFFIYPGLAIERLVIERNRA